MSEISDQRHSAPKLMRRLLREHVLRYRGRIVVAVVCMVLAAAMTAANAYMMQPMLDTVFIDKNKAMLYIIPPVVVAIAVINALASYGQAFSMRYLGQRVISDMQIRMFSHLMNSDLSLFHDQASGRLISRFTNDIQMMRQAITTLLVTLTREVLSMIFLIGVMLYQSVELTLIALVAFPLAIYPIMRLSKRMRKIADGTQTELGEFTARLDEVFQGARTVKAYGREAFEVQRARRIIETLFGFYFKAARVQAAASPMMEALSGIAIASVIAYGGAQVLAGETTPGAFFSFITAFIMAYRPVKSLAGVGTTLQEGIAAANRYFNVLDSAPAIADAPDAVSLQVARGEVKFEQASFYYAKGGGGVHEVSLTLPAGKKVALVGHSGGGKSTLMNLLLRLYDVQHGAITIDGMDLRAATLSSLRAAMAFVPQDTVLFDDTVRANIAYGKLDATDSEVIAAAENAAADDFIRALPQGYDTPIGPHGVRLSGGQRQRLAIARAMLKNAPILLLDEATSALDSASERLVQDALSRLTAGRTTLIIAHRLSTIVSADLIYVIDHGTVAESGTHSELLALGGIYHRLYATMQHASHVERA